MDWLYNITRNFLLGNQSDYKMLSDEERQMKLIAYEEWVERWELASRELIPEVFE